MAYTKAEATMFMTGIVLLMVTLLFVVRLAPYIWKYMQEEPAGVNYTVSDVPGGSLLTSVVIFLLMLVSGIAIVLKVFDLI